MLPDDKYDKTIKNNWTEEPSDEDSGSSQGGQSGQVEFKDFTASAQYLRDDLLPADTKKRLLSVHKDTHELLVKKQKEERDKRQLLKNGKLPLQNYNQALGNGMNSHYKQHPKLMDKAQFSGIDRQVTPVATENVSEANEDLRQELDHQYRLRYSPEKALRFNPKPQYR